jgi:hypothetical protein
MPIPDQIVPTDSHTDLQIKSLAGARPVGTNFAPQTG